MSQIRRRRFLLASGALLASPYALAQNRERSPVIGVLGQYRTPTPEEWSNSPYAKRLRELGWVEGQNIVVDIAYADGNPDRSQQAFPQSYVRKRVDVIVGAWPRGGCGCGTSDQDHSNHICRRRVPGRTGARCHRSQDLAEMLTGVAYDSRWHAAVSKGAAVPQRDCPECQAIDAHRECHPESDRRWRETCLPGLSDCGRWARLLKRELSLCRCVTRTMRRSLRTYRPQADRRSWFMANPSTLRNGRRIVDFANRRRLPSGVRRRNFRGPGRPRFLRAQCFRNCSGRAVDYVDRVLRGARPAELPVELPPKYELAVNLNDRQGAQPDSPTIDPCAGRPSY